MVNLREGTRRVSPPLVVMIVYPLWSHLRSAQVPCLVWYQPVLLAVDLDFHLCLSVIASTTALLQPHLSSYVLPFGEPLNQVVSPNRTARRLSCIGHWVYHAVGAHSFLQPRTTENRTGCIHGGIQGLLFSSASRSFRPIILPPLYNGFENRGTLIFSIFTQVRSQGRDCIPLSWLYPPHGVNPPLRYEGVYVLQYGATLCYTMCHDERYERAID